MIKFQLGDHYLDLPKGTKIPLSFNNPIFDSESFARVFSYPFKLSDTDNNQRALKYPNRIDAKGTRFFEPVKMYVENVPIEIGVLEVTKVKEDIQVVFRNKTLSALTKLEDIKLNNLLDVIDIPQVETAFYKMKFAGTPSSGLFDFGTWYTMNINAAPVIFNQTAGQTTQDAIDHFLTSINNPFYILATAEQSGPDSIIISAQPNEDLLLDNLTGFELIDYKSSAEANLVNMTKYADAVVQEPIEEFALPVIYSPDHYGEDNNEIFFGYLNFWSNGEALLNHGHDNKHWFHTYSPCPRIPYILQQIAEAAEMSGVTGSFFEEEVEELLLFINRNFDRVTEEKDLVQNTMYWLNGYKSKLDLNDFVPEKTAKQFIIDLMAQFCLYANVEANQLHLIRKADQLQYPAIDWTHKAAEIPTRIFEETTGYTLRYSHPEGNRLTVAGQMLPVIIGDGVQPIDLPFHTIHDYVHTYDQEPITLVKDPHTWKMPAITSDDELYALLLYRGLQKDNQGKDYPFAQHLNTNLQETETGTTTLSLTGQEGIYNRYWKDYLPLLQADELTLHFRVNIFDLLQLKTWKNAKRRIHTRNGVATAIVKSLKVNASEEGIGLAEVRFALIA